MSESFTVKFWGVRGSRPSPGQHTVRFGGNTACVEIRAGAHTIILDAGTGIVSLGRQLTREKRLDLTILLSHLHHDHVQGFPFFAPAYHPHARLYVFGPRSVAEVLDLNQSPRGFPVGLQDMNSTKEIRPLNETDSMILDSSAITVNSRSSDPQAVTVKTIRSLAHPGGSNVYRVEYLGRSIVYATDIEGYVGGDSRLTDFANGADLLIHDAQYSEEHYLGKIPGTPSTQGFGHSTAQMACELANAARVRELALFHHDPDYSDETVSALEARARTLFPNVCAAYEGLTIHIGRSVNVFSTFAIAESAA